MKKQQYVAAVACLAAGVIGFVSVYATEKAQEQTIEATEQVSAASNELESQSSKDAKDAIRKAQIAKAAQEEKKDEEKSGEPKKEPEAKATVAAETLHFDTNKDMTWPIEGEILLDYSMDQTIYFPTLEQYRCNPALVIEGAVNDKVFSAARGKITEITENEVTGCTVKQDLGDGYTAIYGQLKELNFKTGDMVEAGQVIGYISEPTKYYSTEGSNLYFELQKNGKAVNPKEYLPELPMDTTE